MKTYCGEDIHAMQTDYLVLAKAATASAAVSHIWDVMVRFRPVLDQRHSPSDIVQCPTSPQHAASPTQGFCDVWACEE